MRHGNCLLTHGIMEIENCIEPEHDLPADSVNILIAIRRETNLDDMGDIREVHSLSPQELANDLLQCEESSLAKGRGSRDKIYRPTKQLSGPKAPTGKQHFKYEKRLTSGSNICREQDSRLSATESLRYSSSLLLCKLTMHLRNLGWG